MEGGGGGGGRGGGGQVKRQNLKSLMVLFIEVSFEGMEGLNVTDVRRERIPLLWSAIGKTDLSKGFCSNMGIRRIHVSVEGGSCMEGVYRVTRSERKKGRR